MIVGVVQGFDDFLPAEAVEHHDGGGSAVRKIEKIEHCRDGHEGAGAQLEAANARHDHHRAKQPAENHLECHVAGNQPAEETAGGLASNHGVQKLGIDNRPLENRQGGEDDGSPAPIWKYPMKVRYPTPRGKAEEGMDIDVLMAISY